MVNEAEGDGAAEAAEEGLSCRLHRPGPAKAVEESKSDARISNFILVDWAKERGYELDEGLKGNVNNDQRSVNTDQYTRKGVCIYSRRTRGQGQ